jgi:putative mycofactocin binding protein MftB
VLFELDVPWRLHPRVAVRPERFGALLYHFDTRKLSFLKTPQLLDVVRGLAEAPTARTACVAAGVSAEALPGVAAALDTLARSQMIVRPQEET